MSAKAMSKKIVFDKIAKPSKITVSHHIDRYRQNFGDWEKYF